MPLIDTPRLLLGSSGHSLATGQSGLISPLLLLLGGGVRAPIPVPYDLIAAISLALGGSSASALFPGGAHEGYAPSYTGQGTGRPIPYAEVYDVSESSVYGSDRVAVKIGQVQINSYAKTRTAARQIGDAVAAILNDDPLVFQIGSLDYFREDGQHTSKDPDRGPGGVPVFQNIRIFNYFIEVTI